MAASGAFPAAPGCPAGVFGAIGVSNKYRNECCAKEGALTSQPSQSPRASSAWSTQDGFVACADPDRETSLEDIARPNTAWRTAPQGRLDQDCDTTCTSRSSDLYGGRDAKSKQQATCDGARSEAAQPCGPDDAAAHQDVARSKLQQPVSPAEQQRLRAARQLEDLLAMIRNEQASERELCPASGFLEQQDAAVDQPITPQMLMIVSSWLAEVAFEFSMQQETLFLAVGLLCRFLDSSTGVPRGVLQLVAVACMMLAAKQDEVIHPTVQELTDIAANCFTTQDLLRMERILLDSLAWRVKMPTTYTFLHLYTQSTAAIRAAGGGQARQGVAAAVAPSAAQHTSDPLSGAVVAKAAYLIELALLDYGMLEFRPSEVAASALLLSESWSPQGAAVDEMQVISGFSPSDLSTCMSRLLRLHQHAAAAESCESLAPLVFIKDKYAQDCWLKASLQAIPQSLGLPASTGAAAGNGDSAAEQSMHVAGCGGCGAQPMEL